MLWVLSTEHVELAVGVPPLSFVLPQKGQSSGCPIPVSPPCGLSGEMSRDRRSFIYTVVADKSRIGSYVTYGGLGARCVGRRCRQPRRREWPFGNRSLVDDGLSKTDRPPRLRKLAASFPIPRQARRKPTPTRRSNRGGAKHVRSDLSDDSVKRAAGMVCSC